MCDFGDRLWWVAEATGSSVTFDYDDAGLYGFLSRYGEPGKPGSWLRISKSGPWWDESEKWLQTHRLTPSQTVGEQNSHYVKDLRKAETA